MDPARTPPPRPPMHPHAHADEPPRTASHWATWIGLTLLAAVLASFGDRLVGRLFAAFEEEEPRPRMRIVRIPAAPPAAAPTEPARAATYESAKPIETPREALQGDLVMMEPEPTGPEGEAGLVAAQRAGTLRVARPSELAEWIARHRAQGGMVGEDPFPMQDVYTITGDLNVPGGLHGAHSVVFLLPRGVPFPKGDRGHSVLLDMETGACVGSVCRTLRD